MLEHCATGVVRGGKARRAVSLGTCGQFTRSAARLNFQSQSGICGDAKVVSQSARSATARTQLELNVGWKNTAGTMLDACSVALHFDH